MMMLLRKKEKGFTLIEVMLVVIIIGIIAIIALPKLLVTRDTARTRSCQSNMQALRTAIEQYNWDTAGYPADAVGDGVLCVAALMGTVGVAPAEVFGPWLPADSSVSNDCPDPDGTYVYDDTDGSFTCDTH